MISWLYTNFDWFPETGQKHKWNHYLQRFALLSFQRNRFHVTMDSYIGRSKEISEGDKNISDSLGCTLCAPFLFLLYFDFICDL